MGKFGLKIKNIEASTLFGYNLGVRSHYEYKNAMFTNSLFYDFLMENGMETCKDRSTRDIICLEFNYGSRSYEDEIKHLHNQIAKCDTENTEKLEKFKHYLSLAEENADKYMGLKTDEIREMYYRDGVDVPYVTRDKQGGIKKTEILHYRMLYRSTGKAKKGTCMFIVDRLYEIALDYLRMGLKLPDENAPIVEISAYSPLVASTIVGKIKIEPENILILKDVDSFCKKDVISIETDENKHCVAKSRQDYRLKNTMFDGQALIDSSIFPNWANGYILLRHHFCKMAAFNSNIQLFFQDYFGDDYETAKVTDMFGNEHYAKDIKLITTDNAMKWLKFDVGYDYWCDRVHENGSNFGIVKTAHRSKLGDSQKMSYQMVNALDLDSMDQVVKQTRDYVMSLKSDDDAFLEYLDANKNFSNDYECLLALVNQDRDFLRSEYFRDRKSAIINAHIKKVRSGKLIQNADNLVIVGSPYAMLLHAVGEDVSKDNTFYDEDGCIQCYTERFGSNEYLAAFRSPFNSRNNLNYLHNVYTKNLRRYFNFGEQIIAVNMLNTDFQDRNNGSDQDSDSLYVTNQQNIVEHAKYCYESYPTIVNNIPKEKNSYRNTPEAFAQMDNALSKAQMAIGESSNDAQLAQTYAYNFDDPVYLDCVCILSVLAQCAIDNAKRRFDIDINGEIRRLKKLINVDDNGYPEFWDIVKKDGFDQNKINHDLVCPMNYLYQMEFDKVRPLSSTIPTSDFFVQFSGKKNWRKNRKVEELIEKYSIDVLNSRVDYDESDYILLRSDFDYLVRDIGSIYISENYFCLYSWLINRAFVVTTGQKRNIGNMYSTMKKNRAILLSTLYSVNPKALLAVFSGNINKCCTDN